MYAANRYSCIERCLFNLNTKRQRAENNFSYDELYMHFPYEYRTKFNYFQSNLENGFKAPSVMQDLEVLEEVSK